MLDQLLSRVKGCPWFSPYYWCDSMHTESVPRHHKGDWKRGRVHGPPPLVLQRRTLPAAEHHLEMLRHGERHILPPGAGHHLHANREPLR